MCYHQKLRFLGGCNYQQEAGKEARISPGKKHFSKNEKITITCGHLSTEHTCTDGTFKPKISPCPSSYDFKCRVVESDLLILKPSRKDYISDGEQLIATCVKDKDISQTLTCRHGEFQPALIPNRLCSFSKAGRPVVSVIMITLLTVAGILI